MSQSTEEINAISQFPVKTWKELHSRRICTAILHCSFAAPHIGERTPLTKSTAYRNIRKSTSEQHLPALRLQDQISEESVRNARKALCVCYRVRLKGEAAKRVDWIHRLSFYTIDPNPRSGCIHHIVMLIIRAVQDLQPSSYSWDRLRSCQ